MAELKTKENDGDVNAFLNSVEKEQKRKDSFEILEIMTDITGCKPRMWGDAIVGFGHYHYKYETGREGDWFLVGFSPRKQNLTLYIMSGFRKFPELMENLGKYKIGSSCLYLNKLDNIDRNVLKKLIRESVKVMETSQGCK